MPELVVGYMIGFFMTAGLVGLHVFLQIRKQKSLKMRTLQNNLKKINLFWSDSQATVQSYQQGDEKKDLQKSIQSVLISGIGFMFLSWLGFLMQLTLMLSLRYLAVKRIETRFFESDLSEKPLNSEKVSEIAQKIMQS